MARVVPLFFALLVVGCGTQPASAPAVPTREGSAVTALPVSTVAKPQEPDPTRLPEDPVAGKLSELQWKEHLTHEEDERQSGFDRPRLKAHRKLLKLIEADRARFDRANSEAALSKVRADIPRQVEEIRRRMHEIDPWGTNSRALPDYEVLATALSGTYPESRLAALQGDAASYTAARGEFDQRLKKIEAWLHEVAESEGEEEREEKSERERERRDEK